MPGNLFDDALAHLDANADAAGTATTAPASTSIFDQAIGVLDRQNQVQQTRLKSSLRQATETTPEKAAEARRLSLKFAVPPQQILRNFDDYQRRATTTQSLTPLQQDTPHLASWLEDPENAAVAHDDMQPMGAMEKALQQAENSVRAAGAGLFRSATTGVFGLIQGAAERAMEAAEQPTTARSLLTSAGELQGPQLFGQLAGRERSSAIAQWAQAHQQSAQETAATVRGPQTGAGRIERGIYTGIESVGMTVPSILGSILTKDPTLALAMMGGQTTGEAYAQARRRGGDQRADGSLKGQGFLGVMQRPDGQVSSEISMGVNLNGKEVEIPTMVPTLTPEEVQQLLALDPSGDIPPAIQSKAVAYARERLATGKSPFAQAGESQTALYPKLQRVPWQPDQGVSVTKAGIFATVQGLIEVGTEAAPLGWLLKDLGAGAGFVKTLAHQALSETLGEEVATAMQDLAEFVTLPENAGKGWQDYVAERPGAALDTLVATVASVGATTGIATGAQTLINGLGQAASASKTAKRSPEAVEHFVAQATADSPTKTVYAPIETWTTYWQSKGEDPARMAADLTGDASAYQRAVDLGTDLEIPLAKYAANLAPTEHNAFFANELRLDPADMNAREAAAYAEQVQQQAQPTEPSQPQPIEQATQLMVDRMVAQGIPQETAQTYGAIWGAGIGTLASNFGIDPVTLQAQYGPGGGPTITREGVPTTPLGVPAEAPPEQEPEGAPIETPSPEEPAPDTILAPDLTALPEEALLQRAAAQPQAVASEFLRRMGVAQAERRATERSAETDPLTGLGNRRALDKALPAAEADPNTSVLFFDANNFGKINKAAGHAAGDAALKDVATALQQAAAEVGMGARVFRRAEGGDEFVALVPRELAAQVRERAETLFGAREFTDTEGQPFEVSLTGTEGGTIAEAEDQLQAAKEARKRAPLWAPSALVVVDTPTPITDTEALDGTLPTAAGDQARPGEDPRRDDGERAALEARGLLVPGGVEDRGDLGGLPAGGLRGLPDVDEVFRRESGDATAARFTPAVTRELARIADELDTFPHEPNVWVWDDPAANFDPNFGTAAGGKALVRPGNAGAPVYDDILAFSPVNTFKGQAARKVRGSRADVLQAVRAALQAQDIPTNLAEGAMRVAEHRAAEDYYYLSRPQLPHRDSSVLTRDQQVVDLEDVDSIEPEGDVDTSFDPTTFKQDQRGEIRFTAGRQFDVRLMERADLSTFLHETGHFFLEVFGDLTDQLATREALTPEQQRLKDDYAALLTWLGAENRAQVTTDQHEQFARGFEAYLMEGKAPSVDLRSAFARARAWLLGIYRNLRNLRVALTPEVRGVFDRLLATDAAIQQAQQQASVSGLFTTAEQAGMSEPEFATYRGRIEDASRKAKEELDRQLLAEVHREQTATWKAQRESIRQQVESEVQQQPVYRVLAAMQKGTHPNGEPLLEGEQPHPLKLSKTIISNRYGAERLKALPKPYIYSREGGLDPDSVAEMFGFSSGDALLTAVTNAQPIRSVIERETAQRMFQQHGSLLLDGTLGEKAQAAVANETREEVIRTELRALIKILSRQPRKTATAIRKGIAPQTVIRHLAAEQIASTRVGDIRPQTYWAAGMRAARQATEFAVRQQVAEAVDAKQKQLYNLALYREAVAQKADMERRVAAARELNSPASRARIGKAGGTFQDQIDGILDQYEFARVSQTALDRRASLRKWIAAQEGEGLPVDLPDEPVDETRRINYRDLTVERLIGVTDGLKQIVHLARLKNKLLKSAAKRDLDETAATLGASIRDQATTTRKPGPRDRRQSEERRRTVSDFFAGHRKLASLLREMDGFEDGGPAWEAIMRPLNEAGDREAEMNAAATSKFAEIIEAAYPGKEKRTLYTRREIPAINQSLSKMERLMVALNWGNDGNRDRVRSAEGWTDQQVRAVLDTLDQRDLDFVQAVFDFFESYRPEIGAKQQRVYGLEPTWVEAAPIQAAAGEIRGGYFPLKYDDRMSASAIAKLDLEAANLAKQASYSQATTKRGHTKDRVEHLDIPVRLDFGVLFEHVKQVIHDLSHHEALIDVGRILGHRDVQQAILETHGDLVYKQIRGTIRDIAFGDVPAVNGFERALNHVRAGATVAGLGWNLTTAFLQPLGLTNSAVRVGPKWIGKGLFRWLRSPSTMVETVEWVTEKSAFMRNRARTQQREINEIRNAVGVNTGVFSGWIDSAISTSTFNTVTRQGIADSYFWLIQQMQRVADVPTWLGQYEKSMAAGEPEERAIALADQAVLDSQGGGQIKDLAQVQRGGPMMKLWTNFYSFFSVLHNQAVESKRRTTFSSPGSVGRMASDYLMLFVVPATLGYVVRNALRPGDEDDEDALAWRLVMETASYISGTMLGLREISSTLQGYYGYEGPAGARAFGALARLGKQVQQGETDAAFWRALNDMGGILFHYPSGQARRTVEGIAALSEGRTQNPGAVIAGPPPKGQ